MEKKVLFIEIHNIAMCSVGSLDPLLRKYKKMGWSICALGNLSQKEIDVIKDTEVYRAISCLKENIDSVYITPSEKRNSKMKFPKTGMVALFENTLSESGFTIDYSRSLFIYLTDSCLSCAKKAKIKSLTLEEFLKRKKHPVKADRKPYTKKNGR